MQIIWLSSTVHLFFIFVEIWFVFNSISMNNSATSVPFSPRTNWIRGSCRFAPLIRLKYFGAQFKLVFSFTWPFECYVTQDDWKSLQLNNFKLKRVWIQKLKQVMNLQRFVKDRLRKYYMELKNWYALM